MTNSVLSRNEWLIYSSGFGAYLLTKTWDGLDSEPVQKCALGAFGRSDKDPDEYIAYISDEFKKYGFPLKQSTIALMRKRLGDFNKT